MVQVNVVDFMRKRCNLADNYSESELHREIGILRTNAANVERPYMAEQGTSGKAIYPTFSFLSHSCICNTRYIIHPDDSMDLRAQVDIKKGDEFSIQYISFLFGNTKRRGDIKACWMFECGCSRCEDTSELGSNLSALLCQDCQGTVLPKSSDLNESTWSCESCSAEVPRTTATDIFCKLEAKMFDTYGTDVAKYELLLEEYSKALHPNNFQILLLERYLSEAMTGQLSISQVERKVELMEHFINIFSLVDPGATRWRAKALFEVSRTKLFLADIKHSNNKMDKEEFLCVLKQNIKDMSEVHQILAYETGAKDRLIHRNAKTAMAQTQDILRFATML